MKKLGVSLSGFKAWKKREPSKTELKRNQIKEDIVDIYNASYQNYGAPKTTAELHKNDEIICERTAGKYMQQIGIKAQWVKPYIHTTVNPDFSSCLKIFSMSNSIPNVPTLYGAAISHISGQKKVLHT